MTYRVRFEAYALVQLNGLATLSMRYWNECRAGIRALDAVVMLPGDGPAYRRTVFGSGWGLLTFHVADNTELIRIFDLTWIG